MQVDIDTLLLLPESQRRKIAEKLWESLAPAYSIAKEDEATLTMLEERWQNIQSGKSKTIFLYGIKGDDKRIQEKQVIDLTSFTLKYDDYFWEDLKNAINWYKQISPVVCNNFLDQLEFAEERILRNPFAFTRVEKTSFRRILLNKFPFKIFFRIETETVVIVAIIHAKRSNRYIKTRLNR